MTDIPQYQTIFDSTSEGLKTGFSTRIVEVMRPLREHWLELQANPALERDTGFVNKDIARADAEIDLIDEFEAAGGTEDQFYAIAAVLCPELTQPFGP